MPRLPGPRRHARHHEGTPTVKILLLTSTITTQQIIEALHIGARGIVLKDALAGPETAIRTVMRGRLLDRRQAGRKPGFCAARSDAAGDSAQRKTYGLTPRELEVVG